MKKISLSIIITCFSIFGISQTNTIPSKGKVEVASMSSNILGVERNYSIYFPKSYSSDLNRKYPVLYLLHGVFGDHTSWSVDMNLEEVANQIIDAGDATEMVIVMPDAGTEWNGYFNMDGWAYESYFFKELLPHIEETYRVTPNKMNRAIAGLSMGGGGATAYAQRNPELFSSVYSLSALFALPDDGGIPFEEKRGKELNRTVKEKSCIDFLQNANIEKLEKLRDIRWFIDCGDDDFILYLSFRFANEMKSQNIPFQMRVRDGGHSKEYWHTALYILLPFVSNGFLGC